MSKSCNCRCEHDRHKVGDRLSLNVTGTVTEVHESYAVLETDKGIWIVEYDDPDWTLIPQEETA